MKRRLDVEPTMVHTMNKLQKHYVSVTEHVGGFREGKFSGKGKLEMFDGTKYNGSFKDGEFHGNGHLFTSLYIYKGYWMNGAYHGKGEIKWLVGSHGNRKMVKGYFRNGILHGINCRT